jgi:hypothetical protein
LESGAREPEAQENYGVFFNHSGQKYLRDFFEDEAEAERYAENSDHEAFERALEEHQEEDQEQSYPELEDFRGMHYVEEVERTMLTDYVRTQLDRGFAVLVG